MKIIVTGGTGVIGRVVLQRCIALKAVDTIFALTRRPLSDDLTASEKVKNIIHSDFSSYPDSLLQQLAGAEACIWSLGVTLTKGKGVLETYREADVGLTIKAAHAFAEKLQPKSKGRKFSFIYVSGWLADRDPAKPLWLFEPARRAKGEAEQKLFDIASDNEETFQVFVTRPGAVLRKDIWMPNLLIWTLFAVREDQLAAVLVDVALNGHKSDTLCARDLSPLGEEILQRET